MNIKQSSMFWLACIIIGGFSSVFMPKAQAHYDENNINHAHVCTTKDPLTVRKSFDVNSPSLGTVAKGAVVQTIGSYYKNSSNPEEVGESWVHIKFKKGTGFINGQYVCY